MKNEKEELRTEFVDISPELARVWMEKDTGNRPITKSHVTYLASQMKKGEWKVTGETIGFSKTDRLINGQHRLSAIIESGVTAKDMLVVYGLDDEAQAVMDTGKSRSAGDTLSMNGVHNHTITAATIKNYLRYKQDITSYGGDKKVYHTNLNVLEVFNSDKKLFADTALYAQKLYKASTGLLPASIIGGFYLLFLERSTKGLEWPVKHFFEALLINRGPDGKAREYESTITTLHKKLLSAKSNRTRIPQRELYGMMIKTWNATIEGRWMKHLDMKSDEEMPKILEHPEATKKSKPDLFDGENEEKAGKPAGKKGEQVA